MSPTDPEARPFDDKPPAPENPEADRQAEALRDKGWVARPDEEPEAHPS